MSGNALKTHSSRKRATRALTWTCLALLPVLAVLTLGTGLLPALTADNLPDVAGGAQIAETRAFSTAGDDVTAAAPAAAPGNVDEFMNNWQNTVRRRPSPRR
jgi:hypothetical protein